MSRKIAEQVSVARPCSMDWKKLTGSEKTRHCSECSLRVHNISELTQSQAARLLSKSNGRLCIAYYPDKSGKVIYRTSSKIWLNAFLAFLGLLGLSSCASSSSGQRTANHPLPDTNNANSTPTSSPVPTAAQPMVVGDYGCYLEGSKKPEIRSK